MHKWIPLIIALVLNAGANVLMKVGANNAGPLGENASFWAKATNFLNAATILAIVLFAANVLAYRKALDNLSVSVAYPIMVSTGMVLITLVAATPLLGERIAVRHVAGMVLVAFGVWLLAGGWATSPE
ncbi:MAG: SMR family transporter [Phycisphaerae bacterium]|jgi:multidrug transporter EmrE-like cation transporter|nr:SMR family transporter [Phycisphaerae bacterium]MDP7289356.1 SMR family transporter [Phycisphaerae bacterium]